MKRRKKYGKTKLESESSDEGVNNQPQTKRGKKNHSNTPPSSGDTNHPLTKKNRGNTGKAVVISSDEESADEGKWLPELFLRADDKKLIETGDWLMDRHITAAQMLLKKDFPHVDGLQVTLLAETGGWNILVNEGVQILNDSNIGFVFLQSDAPRTPLTSMTVGTLMYLKTSSSK